MAFGLRWSVCVHKSLTLFQFSIFIPVIFAVLLCTPFAHTEYVYSLTYLLAFNIVAEPKTLPITRETATLFCWCRCLFRRRGFFPSSSSSLYLSSLFYTWIVPKFWCINRWYNKVFFRQTYDATHFNRPLKKNETYNKITMNALLIMKQRLY